MFQIPTHELLMSRFIESPDIISERAGVSRIRMRDHFLWAYYSEMAGWEESVGEQLIFEPSEAPLRKGIDLVWPTGHVYELRTKCGARCVFYAQSGLVSVHGVLYALFYEHVHVLGSYAWLVDQGRDAELLGFELIRRGELCNILRIEGLHIHRSTGEIVRWIRETGETSVGTGFSDCMRIRPRIPWHTKNFYTAGTMRGLLTLDLLVIRLQRWMRRKCKDIWSTKELNFWNEFRDHGWLAHLNDDVFGLMVKHAVRSSILDTGRVCV